MTLPRFTLPFLLAFVLALPLVAQDDRAAYVTPEVVPVRVLDATASFDKLTNREKLYAHWMGQASWIGALITFEQVSAESPAILEMFQRLFSKNGLELKKAASRRGITDQDMKRLKTYAARFYSNCGNYLSFGDTKFVPRIPMEKLQVIIAAAAHLEEEYDERLVELFHEVKHKLYSLEKNERALGLEDLGTSNYYGENVTQKDIDVAATVMQNRKLEAWNTRLFKSGSLVLKVASVQESKGQIYDGNDIVRVHHGDYSDILKHVVAAFRNAHNYAANDGQRAMIRDYIRHFETGDVKLHKDAMRHWVKDVGPVVETNIGFIETYRDPVHVRAEWEGFVAIVNKEQSAKFGKLVDAAERYIGMLPWDKAFEKDTFKRPDFTSLEVLVFANSGIPAGINIPNYEEVRTNEGFKNVSLGNVLRSGSKSNKRVEYVAAEDQDAYRKYVNEAFEVQVGLHELLGHGSGKLLRETKPGAFNFDRNVIDPTTKKKVATWYKPGQTWGSQFGKIASSYEECRAETVGIYLCNNPEVLKIFGHEGKDAEEITYINWLLMARAGLLATRFYNPETKKWGQAHMQARYAIMRKMMESGVATLEKDEKDRPIIRIDRAKINGGGTAAMGDFLMKQNVFKATADFKAGRALYDKYCALDDQMLAVRAYAMKNRKPRHVWVQPVTDIDDRGNVVLRTYPGTHQGVIDSFLDRYAFLMN